MRAARSVLAVALALALSNVLACTDDGATTVTVDAPESGVRAATLSDKQATVPMFGARLQFARP